MRPRTQTIAVGDLYCLTPACSVPVQPGPTIAYFCAPVPVVLLPGTSNTSVQPSSIRKSAYRPFRSGMLTIHGSLDTSSQTTVYNVSAFGAVMVLNDASG